MKKLTFIYTKYITSMNINDLNNIIKPNKTYSQYTIDELKVIIKNSSSINDIIQKLKLNRTYHFAIFKFINDNKIDTLHFTRKETRKIEDCLKENCHVSSNLLKKYLIKNNLVEYSCDICGIDEWYCEDIVLQLDHINGIHSDNRIENLRLICANCHANTSTYSGRNVKHKEKLKIKCDICEIDISKDNISGLCKICFLKNKEDIKNGMFNIQEVIESYKKQIKNGEYVTNKEKIYYRCECTKCNKKLRRRPKNGICINCFNMENRKIKNRPSYKQLQKDIKELGYTRTGLKYGITSSGIMKWLELIKEDKIKDNIENNNKITENDIINAIKIYFTKFCSKDLNKKLSFLQNIYKTIKDYEYEIITNIQNILNIEINVSKHITKRVDKEFNEIMLKINNLSNNKLLNYIKINNDNCILNNSEINKDIDDNLKILTNNIKMFKCEICETEITGSGKTKLCNGCFKKSSRKVDRPSYEELENKINLLGYKGTGRLYKVSDNTIRKWLKNYKQTI